jgi:ribosomal protein S18 acetylase RimI-like enzyme
MGARQQAIDGLQEGPRVNAAAQPSVATATPEETEQAVVAIVLAFGSDPAARWSYPDPRDYLTHFPAVVRAFGGRAFAAGTAHRAGGFAGAALWLPPGIGPDEDTMGALLQETVAAERQAEVFAVFERMGSYHPSEPHWYLPLIGVDPAQQNKGLGSALLRHALGQCDSEHAPAYLESSNPANIRLYERHGFEVLGTIQEGSSPPIVPMLRPAR